MNTQTKGIEVTEHALPRPAARQLSPGMRALLSDVFKEREERAYKEGFADGRMSGWGALLGGLASGLFIGITGTVAAIFLK